MRAQQPGQATDVPPVRRPGLVSGDRRVLVVEIGIGQAWPALGEIVDRARSTGQPTLITQEGEPAAVIVNYDWYQQAKAGAASKPKRATANSQNRKD